MIIRYMNVKSVGLWKCLYEIFVFLEIAESHLLCDTFLDLHDPHIWWIPNSRTFWRKYGKNPSHIKNRRIPNHEPELFHAVFVTPKKKQIPPLKFSKKKPWFPPPNRITEIRNSISRRSHAAPPLVANFWKSHGFSHQVSGFTFPTNCPHSILPILAVFFVKFPAKRLWGKRCFFQNVFRFRLRGEHPIGI